MSIIASINVIFQTVVVEVGSTMTSNFRRKRIYVETIICLSCIAMTEWKFVIFLSFKVYNHNLGKRIMRSVVGMAIKRKLKYDVSFHRKVIGATMDSSETNFLLLNDKKVLSIMQSSVLER